MVISDEPGYYEAGQYGIRHESLLLVQPDGDDFLPLRGADPRPLLTGPRWMSPCCPMRSAAGSTTTTAGARRPFAASERGGAPLAQRS